MRGAAQLLLEHLPAVDEHHILDIGTGRARDLEVFLEAGHRATGIDVVEVEEWARIRATWGDRVHLAKTPFQRFETTDRYTGALDAGCLHHQQVSEYHEYLSKLHELMVPGGRCVISAFTPPDDRPMGGAIVLADQRINRELSIYQLQQLLGNAGFRWLDAKRQPRDKLSSYYLLVLAERA